MTLIVGLQYQDGLIFAADTQVGQLIPGQAYLTKSTRKRKVRTFSLGTLHGAIGGSGPVAMIEKNMDLFETSLLEKSLHGKHSKSVDIDKVVTLCEDCTKEINDRYGSRTRGEELCFMLGLLDEKHGVSKLFTIAREGVATPEDYYAIIGDGRLYAEYIMYSLYRQDVSRDDAAAIAIYCLFEVQKIDRAVGEEQIVWEVGSSEPIDIAGLVKIVKRRAWLDVCLWHALITGRCQETEIRELLSKSGIAVPDA
ncbi:MAG: hypothetical protein JRN22_00715 [Nitrososphaerota archaeon]|nr:hypothetical protein [Nitrososphaerota archaeon]